MPHYFDSQKGPSTQQKIIVDNMTFITRSGLFSKDHLDNATKLLIDKCDMSDARSVLDLGCGWGAVAILIKKRYPSVDVDASDVTDHAIATTQKNVSLHKVNVNVIKSDLFSNIEKNFDLILTNPPYNAGRKICFAFIEQSYTHLNSSGSLQLVARHQKGGKMLGQHMKDVFGNCEHIAKSGGFRIYKSVKKE